MSRIFKDTEVIFVITENPQSKQNMFIFRQRKISVTLQKI